MSPVFEVKKRSRGGIGVVVSAAGLIALAAPIFFPAWSSGGDQLREENKHAEIDVRDAERQRAHNGMETDSGLDNLFEQEGTYFPDIHGIGYSGDGKQIIVPSHYGIHVYQEGRWRVSAAPAHDYMGFTATDEGFYRSGHPNLTSGLANPLGFVKVSGNGNKLTSLAFSGKSDFHVVAAGYYSHIIYVLNESLNAGIPAGLHYSRNEGKSWSRSRLEGIPRDITHLAAHPNLPGLVAAAASGGLFLSSDFGNTFRSLQAGFETSVVNFHPDGTLLFYGGNSLAAVRFPELAEVPVPLPPLSEGDLITYIAGNPAQREEIAVVTQAKGIYLSRDLGRNWVQIVKMGLAMEESKPLSR